MTDKELRKIAEEATPGPWEVATMKASSEFGDYEAHGIKGVATPVWYSDSDMAHTALEDMGLADADFIATFNPVTVLALLDRVEKAEGELDLMEQTLDLSKMVEDKIKKKLDWAEQELGKYEKRLERTESEYNRLETSHSILEQALQRVRELHQPRMNSMSALYPEPLCSCQSIYPCPTIRALEGDDE